MSDYRIAVCNHTKLEVVQVYSDAEWMCLHNETAEEDLSEVNWFKTKEQLKDLQNG